MDIAGKDDDRMFRLPKILLEPFILLFEIRQAVVFDTSGVLKKRLADNEYARAVEVCGPVSEIVESSRQHKIPSARASIEASFSDAERERLNFELDWQARIGLEYLVKLACHVPPVLTFSRRRGKERHI